MPRKPKPKRQRAPGAGRPVSTGSSTTPLISYRVSAAVHARLTEVGGKLESPSQVANRLMLSALRGDAGSGDK